MTMPTKPRKPVAYTLDDPQVRVTKMKTPAHGATANVVVTPEPEAELPVVVPPRPEPVRRWWLRWGLIFWSTTLGLLTLGLGLAVTKLIEDLFNHSQALGVLGLLLAIVAALALGAIALREAMSLVRLVSVDALRQRAASAVASDSRAEGQAVVGDLLAVTRTIPRLARGRATLESHRHDIIDGRDLVQMAERELMAPLDDEARRLISMAAKRVSIVTAISPRAAIDMLFVLINGLALIRKLADLYGSRPGMLGLARLVRHVVSHLAVTGGMAVTDSLIQQVIGHGLAAKLSARLGEGVLNGLLTARLGLAAMDVTRPVPFSALPRPSLNDLAGTLLRSAQEKPFKETGPIRSGPEAEKR
ncbi:MAG: TIGR01620 family protein [Rhizobiales bacterium]|nr:TIGR01620 family protein [Hyphomicrobiales bacterium]